MKSTDDRKLFGTPIGAAAAAGNIATIPPVQATAGDGKASVALGFPPETFVARAAGGEPPRGQDMNGLLNLLSSAISVLQTGYLGPFDADFAQNIGGYPAGALVGGSTPGAFWVSTADANVSTPGAAGATWQSLFAGYATQDWAGGAFISSSYGISQTSDYAGRSLFMREENPVFGYVGPNGLVWLALPTVAQMEAETTARTNADATLQSSINTEAQTRLLADNTLHGQINDEATARASAITTLTSSLAAEATARTSADATLQTHVAAEATARQAADNTLNTTKANLSGGNTLTGQQTITGNQYATVGVYTEVTGSTYDTDLIKGTSPNGTIYQIALREYAGSHYSMLHYIYDGTNFSIYELPQTAYNGGRLLCPAGTGAVLSDLPTSGTLAGGYYTKIGNVLTQTFSVSVSDQNTVTFPIAFSATPVPPQITIGERVDRDNAVYNVTATGFQVYIVGSGPVTITVSVTGV
ncbi:hypothetical protein [Acetobacter syzygii]|uniref:Uncharacterized protein n=1 Tax=Acetobacter syzygii TaxID=146476 RepID=A0A270BIB4_9PROT|nr:hypothetical protein [Acetobacter syzygii]PAL24763.1 hypothetical protein B9K05_08680 [Acetobacter syzygii]PAL24877.1 hypothetical protein B9K04_08170 [Acetobacter syzygii]